MQLLLVEDDPTLNANISEALKAENYQVISVFDGLLGEKILKREEFNCIILDVNLPGKSGFDICRDFRKNNQSTPVIFLTAFGELEDKVQGFSYGADDYLTKPFFMKELIVRIQALVKRNRKENSNKESSILIFDDIKIDDSTKTVFRNGQEVILTPREYQLLHKLMENPGEIHSKNKLIQEIWGTSFDSNTNTLEVYINFLRNKLDKPFGRNSIKTKVGYGYYID